MSSSQIYRDALALPYVQPTDMSYGVNGMAATFRSQFSGVTQSAARNAWQAKVSLRYMDLSDSDQLLMRSFLAQVQGQHTWIAVPDFRQPTFPGSVGAHAERMICSDNRDAGAADAPSILDHNVWQSPDGFIAVYPSADGRLQLRTTTNPASGTARRVECTTPITMPASRLVACRFALRVLGVDDGTPLKDVRVRYGPAVGSTSNTMIYSAQAGYYTTVFWTSDVQTQYLNIQFDTGSAAIHTGIIIDRLDLMPCGQVTASYGKNYISHSNLGSGAWQEEGSTVEIGGTLQTLANVAQNTGRDNVYPGVGGLSDVTSNAMISHMPHQVMRLTDAAWQSLTNALNYDTLDLDFEGDPSGGEDTSG